jgi:hypothetical protein
MKLFRTVAVLAAAILAGTLVATPAYADEGVPRLKTELTRRLDLRLTALDRWDRVVEGSQRLTAEHKSALNGIIDENRTELTALKSEIAADDTLAELRAHAEEMVYQHRIFLLVGPQVRLTIAGDGQAKLLQRLRTLHGTLTQKVADAGNDPAAVTNLGEMDAALDRAEAKAGEVDSVLAIQPGPDGDAIRTAVGAVRTDLGAVRTELKTAIAEAKAIRDILKP